MPSIADAIRGTPFEGMTSEELIELVSRPARPNSGAVMRAYRPSERDKSGAALAKMLGDGYVANRTARAVLGSDRKSVV